MSTTPDPLHDRPPAVTHADLQSALMTTYGAWLHLAHVAERAGHVAEAVLAQDAAAVLARLMWTDTAA